MNDIMIFLVAQSFIIVGAIGTAYVRLRVSIAELQIQMTYVEGLVDDLKGDHRKLSGKVDGISRHVERLSTQADKL